MKARGAANLFIDLADNKVRIDAGKKRGEEQTFESVAACVAYVQEAMDKAEATRGVALISNVADLCHDVPYTRTPDDELKRTGVVLNLAAVRGDLVECAFVSWVNMHSSIGWRMFGGDPANAGG